MAARPDTPVKLDIVGRGISEGTARTRWAYLSRTETSHDYSLQGRQVVCIITIR